MATSKRELKRWFKEGLNKQATHFLDVWTEKYQCDAPVYVLPGEDLEAVISHCDRVLGVYDLLKPFEEQYVQRDLQVDRQDG